MDKIIKSSYDEEIRIKRNDLCPCESGKKYKLCCGKEENRFAEYISPSGKKSIYNITDKEKYLDQLEKYVNENKIIECYKNGNEMELDLVKEHFKYVMSVFDKLIKPIEKTATCSKGCCGCCSLIVSTTAIEAELIREFIKNKFLPKEIKQIYNNIYSNKKYYLSKLQFNYKYKEESVNKYLFLNKACVFLTKDKLCCIYEVRPYMCRQNLVFSNYTDCSKADAEVISYQAGWYNYIQNIVMILTSISYKNINYTRHLPQWFLKNNVFQKSFDRINTK